MGRLPGGIVDETRDYIIREVDAMHKRRLLKLSTSMLSSAPSKGLPRLLTLSLSLLALSSHCTVTQNLSVLFIYCLSISAHLVLDLSLHSCLPPSSLLAVFSSFCVSVCITVLFRQMLPRHNSYPQHSQPRSCLTLSNLQAGVCYHLSCRLPLPSFQQ